MRTRLAFATNKQAGFHAKQRGFCAPTGVAIRTPPDGFGDSELLAEVQRLQVIGLRRGTRG